ncbi:hypothetical protein D9M68_647330 [compost metagenome]
MANKTNTKTGIKATIKAPKMISVLKPSLIIDSGKNSYAFDSQIPRKAAKQIINETNMAKPQKINTSAINFKNTFAIVPIIFPMLRTSSVMKLPECFIIGLNCAFADFIFSLKAANSSSKLRW